MQRPTDDAGTFKRRRHAAVRSAARAATAGAVMESLDTRALLAVNFTFNIDPNTQFQSIRPKLQALLNAAGAEWSTHLQGSATLQYNVGFSSTLPQFSPGELAAGAAKSAQGAGTDLETGLPVLRLGTITEVVTGVDPNGSKPDAGITIFTPNLSKWFFETDFNRRNAPIPAGQVDGYSVILHEIAHTLGFASTRDLLGTPPTVLYTFDQHVNFFGPGFTQFGKFGFQKDPLDPEVEDDLAIAIYGTSVPMEIGNPNHLGTGRQSDAILQNPTIFIDFQNTPIELLDDLSTDLMGGTPLPGERKTVSRLDLAILKDAGLPTDISVDPTPEGLYTINGTGVSDIIDVTRANGTLIIRVNKSATTFTPEVAEGITAIVINGLNGNDSITLSGEMPAVAVNGGAGSDTIFGGPKADSIYGGGGNDLLFGRAGGDLLRGGDGKDSLYGQGGSDRMFGDAGPDHMDGGVQTDRMNGGSSNDTLIGGTEDDFLFGDAGIDILSGAGGKDRMDGGAGADAFYGGAGNDSVDYSKGTVGVVAIIDGAANDGATGEQDNIVDSENIIGSGFDDSLVGDAGRNSLIGGAGNDTLDGGGFHDTLEGNNGVDSLVGNVGHDSLLGGAGNDILVGSAGLDRLFGEDGDDNFVANDNEIDTVFGGNGTDTIAGENTDDITDVEVTNLTNLPNPGAVPLTVTRAAGLFDEDDEVE